MRHTMKWRQILGTLLVMVCLLAVMAPGVAQAAVAATAKWYGPDTVPSAITYEANPALATYDGLLYAANDQGILTVLDAVTGKMVYEERLNLGGATYPSISLAGKRIYVSSDRGATVVVQPGREYRELARSNLEPFRSSLVFDGKRVYVRTAKHLFCIGE